MQCVHLVGLFVVRHRHTVEGDEASSSDRIPHGKSLDIGFFNITPVSMMIYRKPIVKKNSTTLKQQHQTFCCFVHVQEHDEQSCVLKQVQKLVKQVLRIEPVHVDAHV